MTPPELPDDPAAWPADPFALLGVDRGADDVTVRRAYTQLIRRFKPEHHPEQFCKIREAYEACRQQAAWFRFEPAPPAADEPRPHPRPATPDAPAAVVRPKGEPERLWDIATAGDRAAAYAGLASLAANGDPDATVPLRLYWLLALDAKLDRAKTRHDWLLAALTASRLGRPALELYRRELEADPAAALAAPYGELLTADAARPQLIEAARLRLAAAGRLGRYTLIEFDLKHVKTRLDLDADADWLGLLVSALDWAAWHQPNLLMSYCRDELQALKHLEIQHAYYFDRVDQTLYWGAEGAAVRRPELQEFVRLLGLLWATPGAVGRTDLARGVSALAERPHHALGWLDELFAARGPNLGIFAVRGLASYCRTDGPDHSADLLRGYVRRVPGVRTESWGVLRRRLMDVLIQYRIHPEELAAACAADPEPRFREVSAAVRGDLSLRIAWMAPCLCPPTPA